MKKTLTPLNDVYMRHAQDMKRARDNITLQRDDALTTRCATPTIHFAHIVKTQTA
jgi:hypothetical protein